MKPNTIQQLNQFNKGDKIAVHNRLNGNVSYYATIISLSKEAYIKDERPSRIATLIDDNGNIRENFLGSAKKVN
jgi:hypothetical protein